MSQSENEEGVGFSAAVEEVSYYRSSNGGGEKSVQTEAEWRASKNSTIEGTRSYVEILVNRLVRSMGIRGSSREELVSAGMLGLVEAADRYDPTREVPFKSYAYLRIRGAVIDHIRSCCDLSGKAYRMFRAFEAAHELAEDRMNRRTGLSAQRSVTPMNEAEFGHAIDFLSKSAMGHRLVNEAAGRGEVHSDNDDRSPEEMVAKKQAWEKISKLLATLPEKERTIIEGYYLHGLKFVEVAEHHAGLSKSWVSRLHDRGLEILRTRYLETLTATERSEVNQATR